MLEQPPAFDEAHDVVLAQPFCAHHLHRGLIQAGRADLLLANLRERWGAMIQAGSTTLWEIWSPLASQCHAWSTTPTFDLSTYVLGITPLTDGFVKALIAPQLLDLTWVQGRFPTPQGAIELAWERNEQTFQLTLILPDAMPFELRLPFTATSITVNDQLAWALGRPNSMIDGLAIEIDSGVARLVGARGGTYSIVAS